MRQPILFVETSTRNLNGVHVAMKLDGRTLIGEVVAQHHRFYAVRHFNGESWPVSPSTSEVKVLERTWGRAR